jgi:hypothetical protein
MSHRHYCDLAGHDWQCSGTCECICGLLMEGSDHSDCPVELRACPKHREAQLRDVKSVPSVDDVPQREENPVTTKGLLNIPPEHKLRRALRRLSRPGLAGICVWCGHGYRRGEYSPEAEDAHMLQCPEFPEDGKRQIRERQRTKSTNGEATSRRNSRQCNP